MSAGSPESDVRTIDLGTHTTRVAVSGDPSAETVFVCLHGLVDDLGIWDRITPALAERGAVVRYDQRGHGEAGSPPGPYSRDDLATDAVAVLDALDIDRATLVGHSMGGIMSMTAAVNHPERVGALVLIGTTSAANAKAAAWYSKIAQAGVDEGADGLARTIYGTGKQRRIRGDAIGIAEVTRTLEALHTDPLTPRLAEVECPALLVVGEHDPMGVRATEIVANAISDSTVEFVDGVGHWVHVQQPAAVLTAYDEWSGR
ncbi:MAG: alpha/beta fold hydrolase [Acidimicrobiia bacterium]|nr:alpha/beta fold hydrolase [Acidimicrobiia bacterium]